MVEFSNKWYRETCIENNLNPDNELSKTAIDLARDAAVGMKKFMDAKETYGLLDKLDAQIERLDNERVAHMLDALFYAEIISGIGDSFNTFIKGHLGKRESVMRNVQYSSPELTEIEQRVRDRWEQAMKNMEG